ncbi:MAG: hypothetical protein ACE5IP_04875 [Terriglobia bacterium]
MSKGSCHRDSGLVAATKLFPAPPASSNAEGSAVEGRRFVVGLLLPQQAGREGPQARREGGENFLAEQNLPFAVFIKTLEDDSERYINARDPDWTGALPATLVYDRAGRRRAASESRFDPFLSAVG